LQTGLLITLAGSVSSRLFRSHVQLSLKAAGARPEWTIRNFNRILLFDEGSWRSDPSEFITPHEFRDPLEPRSSMEIIVESKLRRKEASLHSLRDSCRKRRND
jgi:hypothetical protein